MTRVLVVAASVVVRAGLEALLTTSPALTVVGSFADIQSLGQQIEILQPDVVLLELGAADQDLLIILSTLHADPLHDLAIVLLTHEQRRDWIAEALRAGVGAILSPEATADELVAAVEAVATGLVVLQPEFSDALISGSPAAVQGVPGAPTQTLTPRETEVLAMLAEGLGNKTIARELGISEHTVKFHVSSIFSKLNASSRTEAVALGARQGLILL